MKEAGLPLDSFGDGGQPDVLMVDAFERLGGVAGWLLGAARREGRHLTVLTSRLPLEGALRAQVAPILEDVPLAPLGDEAARGLLHAADVDPVLHTSLVEMTGGLPLALRLVSERVRRGVLDPVDPDDAHEVVASLAVALVRESDSEDERRALNALAMVRRLDEPLLSSMLGLPAASLFETLERMSFVTSEAGKLTLHDAVREPIHREHRRGDPAAALEMAERAVGEIISRTRRDQVLSSRRLLLDAFYVLRDEGDVHLLDLPGIAETHLEPLSEANLEVAMHWVRHHEGDESAELLRELHEARVHHAFIVRGADDSFVGLIGEVDLVRTPSELIARDAALRTIDREITALRADGVGVFRWFFARDQYYEPGTQMTPVMLSGPAVSWSRLIPLRWTVFAPTPRERWEPLAPPFRMELLGAGFEMGGRHHQPFIREVVPQGRLGSPDELLAQSSREMVLLLAGMEFKP